MKDPVVEDGGESGASRRPSMTAVGLGVLALAIIIGLGAPVIAESQHDSVVADLARVPAGCSVTVDVAAPTIFVYVETRGHLDPVPGSCVTDSRPYEFTTPPRVRVALAGEGGESVPLEQVVDGPRYDTGDYSGVALRQASLPLAGRYVVTVTAEGDAVVAVGSDVSSVGDALRTFGLVAGAVGVLLGLGLVIRGVASPSRRVRTR